MKETMVVGKSQIRKDAPQKVMATAIYAGDLDFPGMLYGKALRGKYPHAKILSIDTSKAEQMPGVHCVLTAKDIPGENRFGLAIKDQEVLASEKTRMLGDPVALVAAETLEQAENATRMIEVHYEELPGVYSIEQAMADNAPLVHEDIPGNLLQHTFVRKGVVAEGFAKSKYIVENTYSTQRAEHAYLEPETSVAMLDETGVMNVFTSTQYVVRDRRQIAPVLGIPINQVRVKAMTTGGGFGGKDDITTEIQAALLAQATRRPVKVTWSRMESFICSTKRHPMEIWLKTGCDENGKLQAVEGILRSDKGAYCSIGHFITKKAGIHLAGPYYVPNVWTDAYAYYTNNTICGPYRGFGILQASFAHETNMDMLAEKIGMDPLEFRMINALQNGLSTATGQVFETGVGFPETLIQAKEFCDQTDLWR